MNASLAAEATFRIPPRRSPGADVTAPNNAGTDCCCWRLASLQKRSETRALFPLPLLLYSRTRAGLEPERKRLNSASKEENSLEGTVGPYAASAKTHKSPHRLAASFLFEIPAFYRHANKARQTSSIHVCWRSSLERAEMGIDREEEFIRQRWRGSPTPQNNTHAQRCDEVNMYKGGELSARYRYRPVAIK